jgi:Glyoxalase/Bleomycin resistance protein/Dioxygenase superfamily
MSDADTSTRITQIGRVMVPVSDQDRAIEFYTASLGFEKRADVPYADGQRWVEVAPAGASAAIALVPAREGESGGIMTRIALTSADMRSCERAGRCRRCSSSATRTETACCSSRAPERGRQSAGPLSAASRPLARGSFVY